MTEPAPQPGSHLAIVDCCACGARVLAVPHYADQALCEGCRRTKTGAVAHIAPPPRPVVAFTDAPPAPTPRPVVAFTDAPPAPTRPTPAAPPTATVTAICPTCRWRRTIPAHTDLALVLRLHTYLAHDPHAWASGVTGGLRGRRRP